MPKKYRVDMTITNTETNTTVGKPDRFVEDYEDDAEAERKFTEKVEAAKKAGKSDKP